MIHATWSNQQTTRTHSHNTGFCVWLCETRLKKTINCILVQALRFCTSRTAHRGSRGIALPFHDHDTRRGWGFSVTPWLLFTPEKDPVPIVQEAGWAPGSVWTGVVNPAPTGIRSPDLPARSQSLYRLRYPAQETRLRVALKGVHSSWIGRHIH
jgi:hypothetical protein